MILGNGVGRALVRSFLLSGWILLGSVIYLVVRRVGGSASRRIIRVWYRGVCVASGLRLNVIGRPVDTPSTMYVANHCSYFDVPLLGSLMDGWFVAKREVAGWPVLGFLAKISPTVFIERRSGAVTRALEALVKRLHTGDSLILFPEGGTNDGTAIKPFKSALFSVAEQRDGATIVRVQPISIAYTHLGEDPITREGLQTVAWFDEGDDGVLLHLWNLLKKGGLSVTIRFHPPVTIEGFETRKSLAIHCQNQVEKGVAMSLFASCIPGFSETVLADCPET